MNPVDYKFKERKRRPKQSLKIQADRTIKSLIITLSGMICALVIAFLFITSQNAQRGYTLTQLKIEGEDLKEENTLLTTQITQATSFAKLKEKEKATQMTNNKDTQYLTEEDNQVSN